MKIVVLLTVHLTFIKKSLEKAFNNAYSLLAKQKRDWLLVEEQDILFTSLDLIYSAYV